jgi:hypothetical protein
VLHTLTIADRETIALQMHGNSLPENVLVQRGKGSGAIARITNFPYSRMYLTTSDARALHGTGPARSDERLGGRRVLLRRTAVVAGDERRVPRHVWCCQSRLAILHRTTL